MEEKQGNPETGSEQIKLCALWIRQKEKKEKRKQNKGCDL